MNISVQDMDRAVKFYTKLFQKDPVTESERLVEFEFDGVKIGLHSAEADVTDREVSYGDNCFPGFRVEDLDEEKDRVSEFAEIVSENSVGGHRWITVRDSEGNTLELYDGHL
ncbi:Lactoylglutathione lyase [Candidatus Nanohalovita haloferacivicina]|nr:Lactoylglutathione lyase [Candidatus Nanohalobia archaeon BNXNv]